MSGPLSYNGLIPPDDFPTEPFEEVCLILNRFGDRPAYSQFASAWMALSYRYAALAEYDERFAASIREDGPGPSQPKRYMQERDLFGFASSAFSVFEAFHYGVFAVGACLEPKRFPLENENHERNVGFGSTAKRYKAAFPSDPFLKWFDCFSSDRTHSEVLKLRNLLIASRHPSTPPPHVR